MRLPSLFNHQMKYRETWYMKAYIVQIFIARTEGIEPNIHSTGLTGPLELNKPMAEF